MDNSGFVSRKEFVKAINKIGITGLTEENIEELFDVYDLDGSGEIDYKEFTGILFGNIPPRAKKQAPQKQASPQKQEAQPKEVAQPQIPKNEYIQNDAVQDVLLKIRNKLASRGVRGICSIAKNFAIIDDNNSHVLDYEEFKKCCKDFRFGLSEEEIQTAFNAFDRDNSGQIEYDEFLRTIRGEMVIIYILIFRMISEEDSLNRHSTS